MKNIWFERPMIAGYKHYLEGFKAIGAEGNTPETSLKDIDEADAIVAGLFDYNAELMDKAPNLKVIARVGIGVNNVNIIEASKRGIAVVNVPDGPTIATAEQTLALILAVAKNIKQSETRLRAGESKIYARHTSFELYKKTLGLVGFGRIARRVAQTARALDMQVLTFDPFLPHDLDEEYGVHFCKDLMELLGASDIVSIHPPLNDATYKFMNKETFAQMKAGSIFINAGRGGLVDEAALIDALESGQLFGAGLDVTDPEPASTNNPLLHRDNVVVTPHVSSATPEGKARNFEGALVQAIQVLKGERPKFLVNPDVWK